MIAATPSAEMHRTHLTRRAGLPGGLDARAYGLVGWVERRRSATGALRQRAAKVVERAGQFKDIKDTALGDCLEAARAALRSRHAGAPGIDEAMAVAMETADRVCGLRAHPEQVMAALAVHRGALIEMATGEGKTLAIALAAALAGWSGKPCHVYTANDYLAARDAESLGPFYRRCALTAGCVTGEMRAPERREQYARDITYATPREGAADFLRDRLTLGDLASGCRRLLRNLERHGECAATVQRGLYAAIVDEADSTLIDEAATPLIISQRVKNALLVDAVIASHSVAADLVRGRDYFVDDVYHEIQIPATTLERLDMPELPEIWNGPHRREELLRQALSAREFFQRDRHYVVDEGEIVIVDEFTGRLMPQRMWQQGLHQAIETKEGIEPREVSQTLARISFQRFFRQYGCLAGLSGTVAEAAAEVWQVYGLPVIQIPTHRPCIRSHWPARYFADAAVKYDALVAEVERLHASRRPILIGARSIATSEELARRLAVIGLGFDLLNASRHHEEARIVAGAGRAGQITIATNMAGRGTDIVLGAGVRELGGLHVIAAEPNDSQRIDRQLYGRCGRQGDRGSVQLFASMDDALPVRYASDFLRRRTAEALARSAPGAQALAKALIRRAQSTAESRGFEQRRNVMQLDDWLEESLSFAGSSH